MKNLTKNEEYFNFNICLRVELGILVVIFVLDCPDDIINQFKNKMKELAFRKLNETKQLPLVILPSIPRIQISFIIDRNMDVNVLMTRISYPNDISPAYWIYDHTMEIGSGMFKITFSIDAQSYLIIQKRNHLLTLDGQQVNINVVDNPYMQDFAQLSV